MKFSEMPYERIDFDAAKEELSSIIKAFQEAGTPQEQMEVHRRYYKLMGRIKTQATLAEIRHSIDTTDPFYEEEKTYYDQEMPAFSNRRCSIRSSSLLLHTARSWSWSSAGLHLKILSLRQSL